MLRTCVDSESGQALSAQGVLGKHSLDRLFHDKFGSFSHHLLGGNALQASDIAGMMMVHLLCQLLAGEDGLAGVDDDDEFTAVCMRSEFGSVLSS